ncbi:MAG: hypothetical protein ABIO62_09130 [Paracoccaceae bacterium]
MNSTESRPPSRGVYLVVVNDYLVSQDLAETVVDFIPGAEVIAKHTMAEAVQALQQFVRVAVAFVSAGPSYFATTPLAALIHSMGGKVVLVGDAAESEQAIDGIAVLQRPFSTTSVQAHLRAFAPARTELPLASGVGCGDGSFKGRSHIPCA